ncbi:MAG: hypothetical protein ACPGSE_00390 [Synechococcus sp.]
MELTDHQIALLQICDKIRWREEEKVDVWDFAQIRRALGDKDWVVLFEIEQASFFGQAHQPKQSPPPGRRRSPWIDTWLADPVTGDIPARLVQKLGLSEQS